MGISDFDYQVVKQANRTVTLSEYASLDQLTQGKYNRGELVLKNGGLAVINNHVHLTMLNGTVTTKQDNLNVRTAVADLLEGHFIRMRETGLGAALDEVKNRLLGAEHRMKPITRQEVRDMINMLNEVKGNTQGTAASHTAVNSANVRAYQDFSDASVILSKTLVRQGEVANGKLGNAHADKLAKLAISRSRLYQEDSVFNSLVDDFKRQFKVGSDEMQTKLFAALREKLTQDLKTFGKDQMDKLLEAYKEKYEEEISQDAMSQMLRDEVADYIGKLEEEFKSLEGVTVQGDQVVDMDGLLNRKSSVLKKAMLRLLTPNYSMVEDYANQLSYNPQAELAKRAQQQQTRLNDELRTTGIDLWDKHEDAVRQLDDWIDEMRALQPEDANRDSGVISFNSELLRAGVKQGQGDKQFLVTLDSNLLREMVQTDELLECKQKYVKAFKELLGMGFDEREIVGSLSKELMLATDYSTTMQDALQRLRAKGADKVEVVESKESSAPVGKTRQTLTETFQELVKIQQMTKFCQDCLVRIQKEGKEKSADEDAFDKAREDFLRDFKPLVDAIKLRKGGRSIRQRLSDQLPGFIEKLLQRESEVGKRVGYLSDALGEGESADVKNKLLDQPLDINASLTAALKNFLQDKPE